MYGVNGCLVLESSGSDSMIDRDCIIAETFALKKFIVINKPLPLGVRHRALDLHFL